MWLAVLPRSSFSPWLQGSPVHEPARAQRVTRPGGRLKKPPGLVPFHGLLVLSRKPAEPIKTKLSIDHHSAGWNAENNIPSGVINHSWKIIHSCWMSQLNLNPPFKGEGWDSLKVPPDFAKHESSAQPNNARGEFHGLFWWQVPPKWIKAVQDGTRRKDTETSGSFETPQRLVEL